MLSKTASVALVERESSLMSRASRINQTRVHTGSHYLRAPRTALDAKKYRDRFLIEHDFAINKGFEHIYAIARQGSLTSARGFERFCEWLGVDVERVDNELIMDSRRISESYKLKEYSFDPFLIANSYLQDLRKQKASLYFQSEIVDAKREDDHWRVEVRDLDGQKICLEAKCVINATYSNLNSVAKQFGLPDIRMKHEYSELLLANIPSLRDLAVTIMDGPFLSITPYGLSGLHVLSSVIYTHHFSTKELEVKMPCQTINRACQVGNFNTCQTCRDRPMSAKQFMLNQAEGYIPNLGSVYVHGKMETVKSTWAVDDYRDERQTMVRKLASAPNFYAVMSGKVSAIYEMEGLFSVD